VTCSQGCPGRRKRKAKSCVSRSSFLLALVFSFPESIARPKPSQRVASSAGTNNGAACRTIRERHARIEYDICNERLARPSNAAPPSEKPRQTCPPEGTGAPGTRSGVTHAEKGRSEDCSTGIAPVEERHGRQ